MRKINQKLCKIKKEAFYGDFRRLLNLYTFCFFVAAVQQKLKFMRSVPD